MTALQGTHVFHPPGNATKAEVATGQAGTGAVAGRQQLRPPLLAWMVDPRRACHNRPTNWWYGSDLDEDGGYVVTAGQAKRAQELCDGCRFNLECAEYGLRHESFGMWGGIKLNGLNGVQKADRLAGVERERQRRTR